MLQSSQTATWRTEIYRTTGPAQWDGRTPELYLPLVGRFFSRGQFALQQVSPSFAVHVVERGAGVMKTGDQEYEVKAGDVFVFFPGRHYAYHDFPGAPWRYTWFTLEGKQAREALKHVGLTESSPRLRGDFAARMEELFVELQPVYAGPVVKTTFAIASAWRLIDALGQAGSAPVDSRSPAEAARFLIDRHTMEVPSVEKLAGQLGVSRSTLFRQFHAIYGMSPKEHLDAVRIGRARQLLRQSPATLKQIAAACGYSSTQYFIRAFRKRAGVSPGAYRKRRKN